MKYYDFKNISKYIKMRSDLIESVMLGMHEDWCWTAEIVYEEGHFTKELDKEGICIAGIEGSTWATPYMEVIFKDGTEEGFEVSIGQNSETRPEWFSLGALSQPIQDAREGKFLPNLDD